MNARSFLKDGDLIPARDSRHRREQPDQRPVFISFRDVWWSYFALYLERNVSLRKTIRLFRSVRHETGTISISRVYTERTSKEQYIRGERVSAMKVFQRGLNRGSFFNRIRIERRNVCATISACIDLNSNVDAEDEFR